MKYSALTDTKEIQKSFSQYLFDKDEVDDVLLVEGRTDYTFYSRFTSEKKYKIYYDTPTDDNDERESKKKHKHTVKSLVEEMSSKGKNIYGIIDRDYKKTLGIHHKIRGRIHVIDANSLETLIIKYSDKTHNIEKAITNFDDLVRKVRLNNEKEKKKPHKYSPPITEDVLEWAFYIGRIRKINDFKNYGLTFRSVKEDSNFYRKYIVSLDEYNHKKEFNREEYLKDLCNASGRDDYFLCKIKKSINKQAYNEKSVWNICQGHDIFDFIECLNSNCYYPKSFKGKMPQNKRTTTVLPWEHNLLKVFDIKNFQGSPLQKWFDKINSKTIGYWKNR